MFARIFSTLRLRLRNAMSIGNFMRKVWTAWVGMRRPSPGSSFRCFRRPVLRLAMVSAISARSARTRPFELVILSLGNRVLCQHEDKPVREPARRHGCRPHIGDPYLRIVGQVERSRSLAALGMTWVVGGP